MLHYNVAGVVRQLEGAKVEDVWVTAVLRYADAQPSFAERQAVMLWPHPVVYARKQAVGMATVLLDPGRYDIVKALQRLMLPGGGSLAQGRSGGLLRALESLPAGLLVLLGLIGLANGTRLMLAVRGFLILAAGGKMVQVGRWLAAGLVRDGLTVAR